MFPQPQDLSTVLAFDMGIFVTLLLLSRLLSRESAMGRALFGACAAAIIICYAAWRWQETLPPFEWSIGSLWTHVFFGFEAVAITYTLLSIIILLRWRDRSGDADLCESILADRNCWPKVDVFICTYNEPLDVLEKSIIPALAIDYPNFAVWVLDDTRRAWLKEYCEKVGARYITRADNKGAKAGNLNNALGHTASETNAPLILVLDADFAPKRNILRRMVGLFGNPRTGIVQTPQFFYNADPIQHNLMAADSWVDDQRIFFDVFQPAKDAWGAAFCVGTSFVVRRDLLNEIGGFPDSAICEDINLTYTLMRRGYETHWLNELLSIGLCAEGLPEYITQRTRWCLGTMQVALLPDGPLRGRGYSFVQRLHYVHGILNWLCKPFLVLMLIAPSLYWLFGLPAYYADYLGFLRYGLPALLALWIHGGWISARRTLPLFMEVTHLLPAPAVTLTLLSALIRPFGRPFKVTDKGGDRSSSQLRFKMALTFGSISLLSAGGIVWYLISPEASSEVSSLDLFNLLWASVAMTMTFVAFVVCFERPRREERFDVNESAVVLADDNLPWNCRLTDLSLNSAAFDLANAAKICASRAMTILIADVGFVSAKVEAVSDQAAIISFELSDAERIRMLIKLFSVSSRHRIADRASFGGAFTALFRRSFGMGAPLRSRQRAQA